MDGVYQDACSHASLVPLQKKKSTSVFLIPPIQTHIELSRK